MSAVIVWSKPSCVQCTAVKRRLTEAGVPFEEYDLTAAENARHLDYFRGLGYSSAPITEFREILAAGFMPSEVDRVIAAWRAANVTTEVQP